MIRRPIQKNKYGYDTTTIMMDSIFLINIHRANEITFIVEFIERGFIFDSTHFTFTSNANFYNTLNTAIDKVGTFFRNSKSMELNETNHEKFRGNAFRDIQTYYPDLLR